ncbi:MAG: O-antigen ligase family protein, partial [Dehalococcoidia bacterium]
LARGMSGTMHAVDSGASGMRRICRIVTVALSLSLPFGAYEVAGLSVVNVAIISSLVFTYVYLAFHGTVRRHNALPLWIAAFFLALNVVATFEAVNPIPHISFMVTLTGAVAVFTMSVIFADDRKMLDYVCRGLFVSALVATAGAAVQGTLGGAGIFPSQIDRSRIGDIPRVVGFIVTHGLYAQLVAGGALIAFSGVLPTRGPRVFSRKVALLALVVSVVGIVFSQSRSQMLGTAAGFAVFALLSTLYLRGWRRGLLMTVIVLGAIGLSIVIVPLAMTLIAMSPINVVRRFEGYDVAIDLIRRYPVTGVGRYAFIEMVGGDHVLHNTFLSVGVSTGIPGMVVLFVLMATATIRGFRGVLRRDDVTPVAIGLLSAFTAIFVVANLYDGLNAPIYWVVMALLMNIPFIPEARTAVPGRQPAAARATAPPTTPVPELSRSEV